MAKDEGVAEVRRISDLAPDDRNANRGTERGNALIEKSLRDYGAGRSILIDKHGKIIAGNKTVENAAAIGLDEMLVVRTDGKRIVAVQRMDLDLDKDPRARELAIADNRSGDLNLEWDPQVIAELGKEIDLAPFFTESELEKLCGPQGDPEQAPEAKLDVAEELRKKWRTKAGQTWIIPSATVAGAAPHRILCGDSTDKATVARLMGDVHARMGFTDPPWNVGIGADSNPKHRQRQGLKNDALPPKEFEAFVRSVAEALMITVVGDVYVVLGSSEWPTLDGVMRGTGYHWSATIIWAKDTFVLGRSKYQRRYEPLWYGWHSKSKSSYRGERDQDDVWEIARPKTSDEHPTMKPVALPTKAIVNSSEPGDVVLDLFLGAGSTMVAAEQNGRICYGIEIEPKFVAVVLERMAEMGLKPVLQKPS